MQEEKHQELRRPHRLPAAREGIEPNWCLEDLKLIRKWLKAGILEPDGAVNYPEKGSPQGGIVSPREL